MAGQEQTEHPLRASILSEVHARPYTPIQTPRSLLKQAFVCKPAGSLEADIRKLSSWCQTHGIRSPNTKTRQHTGKLKSTRITWERHTEFVTLTWDCPYSKNAHKNLLEMAKLHSADLIACPPQLISSTRLDLLDKGQVGGFDLMDFSSDSLCMSDVEHKRARIITDFRQDEDGSTRFMVQNNGLAGPEAGILVRRLLEIETYRIMALLGFEAVKKITPDIASIEVGLVRLTSDIRGKSDLQETRETLENITDIAAELANLSASSQYRLSATKAYFELVKARLMRIDETAIDGYSKVEEFLNKRLYPAMRTCQTTEKRIGVADKKLSRATELLRTKVDIQMQAQNHQLLDTMNQRALMQYRLQTTVEGLSIAAVSYYIVGLFAYFAKGIGVETFISTKLLTAISVPIVVFGVWYIIRRVKKHHEK